MKLFMIRHGQSEANLGQYYTGQMDVKLTARGREQALQVRPVLESIHFDKVYSSDLSRAYDTCMLALSEPQCEKTQLLREYDVGTLAGVEYKDVPPVARAGEGWGPDYTAYGGENAEMVGQRVETFLRSLESQSYNCVAAFAHYGVMNAMLRYVLNVGFENRRIKTDNCAIHVFEFDGTMWRLLALNYMSHIDM